MKPKRKKLWSSDPDLTVIVGTMSGSGDGSEIEIEIENENEKWNPANLAAKRSKYIDTMLSMPMVERKSHVISFPGIDPSTWDEMMKFIDDPVAARQMNMKDVLKVAKNYNKYDFCNGKSLCNFVLSEYFKLLSEKTENVDDIIEAVLLARDANLNFAYINGMDYIWKKVRSRIIPYGWTMFS
jgi:hypothetical protein